MKKAATKAGNRRVTVSVQTEPRRSPRGGAMGNDKQMTNRLYCLFQQYKSSSLICLFHLLPPIAHRQSRKTPEKKSIGVNASPSPVSAFCISVPFCVRNSVKQNQIKNYVVECLFQFYVGFFHGLGECHRKLLCAAKCPSKCINLHKIDCTHFLFVT